MNEYRSLSAGEGATPSRHILVVDDDSSLRQFGVEVLKLGGYVVDAAEDGAAAWQALNTGNYDLLVTDNKMPKVTGVELLKRLHDSHMSLPVIMATGQFPEEEFIGYPWLRPDAVLLKPFTIAEMLDAVANVLRATDRPPTELASQPGWSPQLMAAGLRP